MLKLISCGILSKNYLYMLFSIIFLLAYRIIFGYTFDRESEYTIKFKFSSGSGTTETYKLTVNYNNGSIIYSGKWDGPFFHFLIFI